MIIWSAMSPSPSCLKRMVGAVDGLFACSSYVAEPLLALNPSTPVRVVYNPVDIDRFLPWNMSSEQRRAMAIACDDSS